MPIKFVSFLNEEKAKEISELLNIKYMEEIITENDKEKTIYVFIENDNLNKLLQNKQKYSKRDYFYRNTMNF